MPRRKIDFLKFFRFLYDVHLPGKWRERLCVEAGELWQWCFSPSTSSISVLLPHT